MRDDLEEEKEGRAQGCRRQRYACSRQRYKTILYDPVMIEVISLPSYSRHRYCFQRRWSDSFVVVTLYRDQGGVT